MQNSVELLKSILHVVGKIEQNQRQGQPAPAPGGGAATGSIASALGSAIRSFIGVRPAATKSFLSFVEGMLKVAKESKDPDVKKLKLISESINVMGQGLPELAEGLGDLGKIRTVRVQRAITSLQMLYDFMDDAGDPRSARRVDRAVKTFEKMGKSLRVIAKPIKTITLSFAYLGLGILALAGSLVLTSLLLKLSSPTDVLIFLGSLVVGVVLMFSILALARKLVDRGTDTIKDIGLGMAALALGMVTFALTLRILPIILGGESGGSIAKSLLVMFGIVAVSVGMFALIGAASGLIKKGVGVVFLMSAGMAVLSLAIISMGMAARYLMGGGLPFGAADADAEKDENKRMILKGLGAFGLIVLASVATFALLGIPVVAGLVLTGIGVGIAMSVALILLAKSVTKLYEAGKTLQGEPIAETIGDLIGGTLKGFIAGVSVLSGGKKGIQGIAEFIKNSAKIFAGTAVLMSVALALSQFAKAISAFAELEQMRVIEGYDDEGRPIFGDKVDIRAVSDNITYSISTFLEAMIESTEGLTKRKAAAIRKMGRALTGRRGILSAVIQFADALKTYAEFGENNEIGYIDFDDEGNEIRKKVAASVVVDNMIGSFLYFTDQLFTRSEEEFGDGEPGISGRQKRRMRRMSKALTGKHGILGAVMQFSETLQIFAKFGENNEIPIIDEEGKVTGTMSVGQIANNIVKTLTEFSDVLADKLEKGEAKDASKALKKYEGMISQLSKLSSSLDGFQRLTTSVKDLAEGIGDLAVSINDLDVDKLSKITSNIVDGTIQLNTAPRMTNTAPGVGAAVTPTSSRAAKAKETDWDTIAAQIGDSVGAQIVAAMKSGQMKFEFSGVGSNNGIIEFG